MNKKEIIKVVSQQDGTTLSFPNRGPWGEYKWRGNCSGFIQASLIWKYQVKKMAELFAGSGTGSDVCRDMEIQYIGADLNPNPVRKDILVVDATRDEVPVEFTDADMIFMHPPYGAEIGISYAGSMFPDPTGQLRQSDLGQMKWDAFMSELNSIIMKYYAAMSPGARMSILMGDVRRNQKFHSMLCDVVKPGILEQVLIKAQYNTYSERNGFVTQNRGFYPIQHEYIMVVKKSGGYIVTFKIPKTACLDIRDSEDATWRDVVLSVLNELGTSTLKNIYEQIDGHNKARNNTHWKEKIRQTLQRYACFSSIGSGKWQVVA